MFTKAGRSEGLTLGNDGFSIRQPHRRVCRGDTPRTGTRNYHESERPAVISVRFVALVSTFLLVTGALLVGDALHGSVVTGQYPVSSPAAVLRAVAGVVCIALGYRLKTPPSEYTSLPSDAVTDGDSDASEADHGDFDPEMSPLGEDGLEAVDGDDE